MAVAQRRQHSFDVARHMLRRSAQWPGRGMGSKRADPPAAARLPACRPATVTDETDLPTPRTTLASRYVRVLLTCWHCRHQADAGLPALIASGRGDVPLVQLRWRCARCRSGSRDTVMPCRLRRVEVKLAG